MSVWRYSHFVMAVFSFLFLLIAAVTGVILSLEPISINLSRESFPAHDQLSVAEVMTQVNGAFDEVFGIKRDSHHRTIVDGMAGDDFGQFYINPATGEVISTVGEQAPVFQLATSLHRSLMLGTVGRIIVGICSFALLLIAMTGLALIARKQGGWRYLFKRSVKEKTAGYYHTELSKVFFLPLTILAISGVFLSLDRFFDFSHHEVAHQQLSVTAAKPERVDFSTFPIFQQTRIGELRSLEFPFSSDPEDYLTLSLTTQEQLIDQYRGKAFSTYQYPMVAVAAKTIFAIHTGSLGSVWAALMGISSLVLPFFIITGFVVNRRRSGTKIENPFTDDQVEYLVVFGSENGSTRQFAMQFHAGLMKAGLQSACLAMNDYRAFPRVKHLVVFTSTYGVGEAPANANQFTDRISDTSFEGLSEVHYSVLGFGSTAYQEYCGFAKAVDQLLAQQPVKPLMDLQTVNNGSIQEFEQWLTKWKKATDLSIAVDLSPLGERKKTIPFEVMFREDSPNPHDHTFVLGLAAGAHRFRSGDLLAIYPPGEHRERYYSIGRVSHDAYRGDLLMLSVKKHEQGKCSRQLSGMQPSDKVEGYLVENQKFHLPAAAKKVVLICNGTGIAPFLGMLSDRERQCEISLYWGGQNSASLALFQPYFIQSEKVILKRQRFAFSRHQNGQYIQEVVKQDASYIADVLDDGGMIMVCGSLQMYAGVAKELESLAQTYLNSSVKELEAKGQILHDCY